MDEHAGSRAVPTIDIRPWFDGDMEGRARVAAAVDRALQGSGFMLVTGHGLTAGERAEARAAVREFFLLPDAVKRAYAAGVDGRGWLPPGVEANAGSEGTPTPPDLKESYSVGADTPTGHASVDARWFQPNPWPHETPGMAAALQRHIARLRAVADELMRICAVALAQPPDFFAPSLRHPTWTFNANRYPPMSVVGRPEHGQFRIGPHTDFGTLTLLDREPGAGGLQVFTADEEWVDAPYHPEALTINVGDLLARWTGDRWLSARHRVLPPQESAPEEDLISLVFFYECDTDALVTSLDPPVGRRSHPPVVASEYLEAKYQAIAVR